MKYQDSISIRRCIKEKLGTQKEHTPKASDQISDINNLKVNDRE